MIDTLPIYHPDIIFEEVRGPKNHGYSFSVLPHRFEEEGSLVLRLIVVVVDLGLGRMREMRVVLVELVVLGVEDHVVRTDVVGGQRRGHEIVPGRVLR